MCKIQELLYLAEFFREAQTVLCIYSVTFEYSLLIKKHMQGRFKLMTERKFFDAYYHSLLSCT